MFIVKTIYDLKLTIIIKGGLSMEDILFEDINIENSEISDVYAVEGNSYDYFTVYCKINGVEHRVLDKRNSRCSDMVFTDTQHNKNHTVWLIEKLGGNVKNINYTFNHNSSTWEEPIGECDGYYGDGLDHIEELWYMD